jgi:hypothetical protein
MQEIHDKDIVDKITKSSHMTEDQIKDFHKIEKNKKIGLLTSIARKDKNFWNNLGADDDERTKTASQNFYLLINWLSTVGTPDWNEWKKNGSKGSPPLRDSDLTEYYLLMTNELINKKYFETIAHPQLLYYLTCLIGTKTIPQHGWIQKKSKPLSETIKEFIRMIYPNINEEEMYLFLSTNTDNIKEVLKKLGYDDKKIKVIEKEINEVSVL